jgi:hypothetical protein
MRVHAALALVLLFTLATSRAEARCRPDDPRCTDVEERAGAGGGGGSAGGSASGKGGGSGGGYIQDVGKAIEKGAHDTGLIIEKSAKEIIATTGSESVRPLFRFVRIWRPKIFPLPGRGLTA